MEQSNIILIFCCLLDLKKVENSFVYRERKKERERERERVTLP